MQLQVFAFGYFPVALTTIESFDQNQLEFGRLRQEEAEVEKLSAEASQKILHFVAGSPGSAALRNFVNVSGLKGVNTRVKCMQVLQHQSRIQQQEEELCSLRKERFLHLYRVMILVARHSGCEVVEITWASIEGAAISSELSFCTEVSCHAYQQGLRM